MRLRSRLGLLAVLLLGAVLGVRSQEPDFFGDLPPGFPRPPIPADNPLTVTKVTLGRYLFYDTRLSENGTQACATCHEQRLAFTDGRARAIGSTGQVHPRSSMSLVNVAYASALTWGDPRIRRLEDQALIPKFGTAPVELGLPAPGTTLVGRLLAEPRYAPLFAAAFPSDPAPVTVPHITQALASFERTIVSARSPYDRYHYLRDDTAVPEAARRGEVVFFSRSRSCFRCHGGFNFSGATATARSEARAPELFNTGLYNLPGLLSYPTRNTGLYEVTHDPADVGKFKVPTLRNVALTAPYMHDGSVVTLDEVFDHYMAGGRTITGGAAAGVGHDNPNKSPLVSGFTLSAAERADLRAFLESLSDTALLSDARWGDPWK